MRIVFMGTPDFAAVSLQRLLDERFDVVGVFTQPDKPRNRNKVTPSPVKEYALSQNIPVFQPVTMRDGTALADLQSLRPDILVVVAYGRILPDDLLAVAPYGAVNVHGSLLPKNPAIADFLIRTAVERRYGTFDPAAAGQPDAQRAALHRIDEIADRARRVAMSRPR